MKLSGLTDVINAGRAVTEARVYNGFNWPERAATNKPAGAHRRRGNAPTVCSITGFSDPSQPSERGYIYGHNEDYARPLWWLPVSRRTHAQMHARFHQPRPWFDLVAQHYVHGAWFTFLSMNPTLQWPHPQRRPFWSIYPDGLPDAGEVWPEYADQLGISREMYLSEDLRVPIRKLWRIAPRITVRPDVLPRTRTRR